MSLTIIPYPAKRNTFEGQGDPIFSGDIRTANEQLLAAIVSLIDDAIGFYIVSGLVYSPFTTNYSAGIVYYNGNLYSVASGLLEGKYLNFTEVDTLTKLDSLGVSHQIYKTYVAVSSDTQVGTAPQFSGFMLDYKISLSYLKLRIDDLYTSLGFLETDLGTLETDVNLKAYKAQDSWSSLSLLNSWGGAVHYIVDNFGFVRIRGSIIYSISVTNRKISALPHSFTGGQKVFICATENPLALSGAIGACGVFVKGDGIFLDENTFNTPLSDGTYIYLDSIIYPTF